jgi:glycosyltransferase involved in cell wall biosynthesis
MKQVPDLRLTQYRLRITHTASRFSHYASHLGAKNPMSVLDPTPHLSIVLPVYNEAGSLPNLIPELTAVLGGLETEYEIIAVDDGSTDDSLTVLHRLQIQEPHLRIVQFRRNFGQTAAFAAGFDYARGQVIVTLDADGQNDPTDIPRLLAVMEEGGYDMVNGCPRWPPTGSSPMPATSICTTGDVR